MCVYSKVGANKKYQPNKKNGGVVEIAKYDMLRAVEFKCGTCLDCRRARANTWRIRLREELKQHTKAMFVTLTFSDEAFKDLIETKCDGVDEANKVATKSIRLFLERYRKHNKRSVKHWFIVEIGGGGTERAHIHGIIFGEVWTKEELGRYWKYGRCDVGYECSEKTINYILKYMTKLDEKHKDFISVILTSPGMGKAYIEKHRTEHAFRDEKTYMNYRAEDGSEVSLPDYYRRKLWTDEEREELRAYNMLLSNKKWVGRTAYIVETVGDSMKFEAAREDRRMILEKLGFPSPWEHKLKKYKTINKTYRHEEI